MKERTYITRKKRKKKLENAYFKSSQEKEEGREKRKEQHAPNFFKSDNERKKKGNRRYKGLSGEYRRRTKREETSNTDGANRDPFGLISGSIMLQCVKTPTRVTTGIDGKMKDYY